MARTSVLTETEYGATDYDAVLIRETTVLCVDAETDDVRVFPMDSVLSVDGNGDDLLVETEVPDSFYGGADTAFIDLDTFDTVREHLDELQRETY